MKRVARFLSEPTFSLLDLWVQILAIIVGVAFEAPWYVILAGMVAGGLLMGIVSAKLDAWGHETSSGPVIVRWSRRRWFR